MASDDKLDALQELSQNFPKYSAAIARHVVLPENITSLVPGMFRRGVPTTGIFINGKLYNEPELNAYS